MVILSVVGPVVVVAKGGVLVFVFVFVFAIVPAGYLRARGLARAGQRGRDRPYFDRGVGAGREGEGATVGECD